MGKLIESKVLNLCMSYREAMNYQDRKPYVTTRIDANQALYAVFRNGANKSNSKAVKVGYLCGVVSVNPRGLVVVDVKKSDEHFRDYMIKNLRENRIDVSKGDISRESLSNFLS